MPFNLFALLSNIRKQRASDFSKIASFCKGRCQYQTDRTIDFEESLKFQVIPISFNASNELSFKGQ